MSLALRKESKAQVFQSTVLKKGSGHKRIDLCVQFTVFCNRDVVLYSYKPPDILMLMLVILHLAFFYLGTGLKISIML